MSEQRYWRVQLADDPLSRSHRSQIGWEEEGLGYERGTSASTSLDALADWSQGGHGNWIGPVDIVRFRGLLIGRGTDGEPVVTPTEEIARYRIIGGRELGARISEQLSVLAESPALLRGLRVKKRKVQP